MLSDTAKKYFTNIVFATKWALLVLLVLVLVLIDEILDEKVSKDEVDEGKDDTEPHAHQGPVTGEPGDLREE